MQIEDYNPQCRWGDPIPKRYFARIECDGEQLARVGDASPEAVKARAERLASGIKGNITIHMEQ